MTHACQKGCLYGDQFFEHLAAPHPVGSSSRTPTISGALCDSISCKRASARQETRTSLPPSLDLPTSPSATPPCLRRAFTLALGRQGAGEEVSEARRATRRRHSSLPPSTCRQLSPLLPRLLPAGALRSRSHLDVNELARRSGEAGSNEEEILSLARPPDLRLDNSRLRSFRSFRSFSLIPPAMDAHIRAAGSLLGNRQG
ncbi:hypothetical protein BJY59DRAFT_535022 [Rhodotorula toruloides]